MKESLEEKKERMREQAKNYAFQTGKDSRYSSLEEQVEAAEIAVAFWNEYLTTSIQLLQEAQADLYNARRGK